MEYSPEWDKLPRRERKKLKKKLKLQKQKRQARLVKVRTWTLRAVVAVAVVSGAYVWLTTRSVLPPTDFANHVEVSPSSHVLDTPMPVQVQKHMLEHADGSGPPGVIINYNCRDFDCEPDLLDDLAEIANQYPEFVYLSPYPGMTKKLAITRYRSIKTFDSFDREALITFIEGR